MIIIQQGVEGSIAITLPQTYRPFAEEIHTQMCAKYPKATVRVVVNHCLAPEVTRADRVDVTFAKWLVETLRSAAAPAIEPSTLHEKIATCLGWSVDETHSLSLRALRDLVSKHDPRLAAQIERAAANDPGEIAYCCFCSGKVLPADYVCYAHVPGSERPAHKACADANPREPIDATKWPPYPGAPERMLVRLAFTISPEAVWSQIKPSDYYDIFRDDDLRAMTAIILARIA